MSVDMSHFTALSFPGNPEKSLISVVIPHLSLHIPDSIIDFTVMFKTFPTLPLSLLLSLHPATVYLPQPQPPCIPMLNSVFFSQGFRDWRVGYRKVPPQLKHRSSSSFCVLIMVSYIISLRIKAYTCV